MDAGKAEPQLQGDAWNQADRGEENTGYTLPLFGLFFCVVNVHENN